MIEKDEAVRICQHINGKFTCAGRRGGFCQSIADLAEQARDSMAEPIEYHEGLLRRAMRQAKKEGPRK